MMSGHLKLANELGYTSMLLQDTYGIVRAKEEEVEALKATLNSMRTENDSLKAQLLLMQMLVQGVIPKAEKVPDDEYSV